MTEFEIAERFFARAKPPLILFRYRPPTEWTLAEISEHKIYAAKPEELNDPFECSAPVLWNVNLINQRWVEEYAPKHGISREEAIRQYESSAEWGLKSMADGFSRIASQTGIICFTSKPDSIRMWAFYAGSHKGICVGYDTQDRPFRFAMGVKYENPKEPFDVFACLKRDPTEIADHVALRKAEEWKSEDEYRIPVNIDGSPRLIPFRPSAIKEIRLGARIDEEPAFKEKVLRAVAILPKKPKIIQMRCDFDRFVLTETEI